SCWSPLKSALKSPLLPPAYQVRRPTLIGHAVRGDRVLRTFRRALRGLRRGGAGPPARHPPLDIALWATRHGRRPRRYVDGDGRAGGGVGAVAEPDGGDEHVVAAHPHVVARHGVMLGDAVVVDEDATGADVGAGADGGVAD